MGSWQLQEAKAKLSEVINRAEKKGPQVITRRGVETAVIVSFEEWERVQIKAPDQPKHRAGQPLTKDEQAKSEAFLKLLQSGPDFEIPDRHAIRMRKPVRL